jgi:ABC-type multidrug transport system fused ATPase/permease subunit
LFSVSERRITLPWLTLHTDNPAVCAGINTYASKFASEKQKIWSGKIQTRIASTASMLGAMKSVKMMGLAGLLSKSIQRQRAEEMKSADGYRWLVVLTNMTGYTPQIFAPVLTFVAYEIKARVQGSDSLSTNQAITSLATITLLTTPASTFLTAIPETGAAIGCFERIQKFLVAPSWEDYRRHNRQEENSFKRPSRSGATESVELQSIRNANRELAPHSASGADEAAIVVREVTVKPSPSADAAIRDINIQFKLGSTTIITGPVGSGKTTLIRAVLGELPLERGEISVSSLDTSYCGQTPWILNTTIRQNICGLSSSVSSNIDEAWYNSVLQACALDQDLQQLPDGDLTIPGSRGMTLSGGQKQRVALARAVYAKPRIVLLDDVISALDNKTEKVVVDRLMGPDGLFRKLNSTVLLITHSSRHFHLADHIVVLGADGKVAQQGNFDQLREQEGYISNLVLGADQTRSEAKPAEKSGLKKKKPPIKTVTATDVSDLTRKTGDIAVYRYYFKSISPIGTFCFLASTALFVFTQFFPQIWLVWWTEANGHETAKFMSVYIILAVASWIFRAGTLWWILLWISPRSSIKLHQILLNTAVKAPQSFYAKTDTGVTLNRFSQDIGLIDRMLPLACGRVVLAVFMIFAQTALIAQGSSYMAIAIPFVVVAFYGLQKVYLLTSRQLRFLDLEARSPVYTHFLECLEGLSTIRAFGWANDAQMMEIDRLDRSQRPYYLLYCLQRWLSLVLDLMVAAVGIVVVALATRVPGQSSGAAIGIALNNILGFNQSLRVLVESWTQLETSLGAIARLRNFELTTPPEDKPEERETPPAAWPDKGRIDFKDLTASYGPSAPALQNISMTIMPGQKVGICGRTGR